VKEIVVSIQINVCTVCQGGKREAVRPKEGMNASIQFELFRSVNFDLVLLLQAMPKTIHPQTSEEYPQIQQKKGREKRRERVPT